MVTLICAYCNNEFEKSIKSYNHGIKRGCNNFYCNRKCMGMASRKIISYHCDFCNKEIYRLESISRNKNNLFCSRKCNDRWRSINKVGENSVNYKHGRDITYRKKALEFHGNACLFCGYNQELRMIEVHHIDSNRSNNEVSNTIPLCHWCHKCITRKIPLHPNQF